MLAFNKAVLKTRVTVTAVILGIIMLIFLGFSVILYSFSGEVPVWLLIVLLIYTAYFIYVVLTPLIVRTRVRKSIKKRGATESELEFDREQFTETYKNRLSSGTETRSYKDLVKVIETDGYFFLFVNRAMAYIVKKSDMTQDQIVALRLELSRFVPEKKYKNIIQ